MLNSLRVPEKLYSIAMWLLSVLFAGFLIGMGSKIIGELPGVDRTLTIEQFMPQDSLTLLNNSERNLALRERELEAAEERASLMATAASNAYSQAQSGFSNWIAARTATTDPQQDPQVLSRTRALDTLGIAARDAQAAYDSIAALRLDAEQQRRTVASTLQQMRDNAMSRYDRAQFRVELSTFMLRLLLTLPLLVVSGWLIARKRSSAYWPLARGFILFSAFAFFVELVPYLPSYGGYVRYGVGIIVTAVAAHYLVRGYRLYNERRQAGEQLPETERRQTLGSEVALKRMAANVCPSCERPLQAAPGKTQDYCVYCGLRLYDDCTVCNMHKNAFYQYCPSCGTETAAMPG